MGKTFIMLGIESSCDETAAAIVRDDGTVMASQIASQMDIHASHGGVVPEIAARAHAERLDLCVANALEGSIFSLPLLPCPGCGALRKAMPGTH